MISITCETTIIIVNSIGFKFINRRNPMRSLEINSKIYCFETLINIKNELTRIRITFHFFLSKIVLFTRYDHNAQQIYHLSLNLIPPNIFNEILYLKLNDQLIKNINFRFTSSII